MRDYITCCDAAFKRFYEACATRQHYLLAYRFVRHEQVAAGFRLPHRHRLVGVYTGGWAGVGDCAADGEHTGGAGGVGESGGEFAV